MTSTRTPATRNSACARRTRRRTCRFRRPWRRFDGLEGTPLPVCFYGPVWLALARLFAGGASGIVAAIVALRVLGLLTFAIVLVLLHRRGLPLAALAVLALDPAMYSLYVAGPHFALDLLHRYSYGHYTSSDGTGYRALIAQAGRIALALVAGAALVLAFVRKRYVRGAAPAFASLSTLFVYPWYVVGGLPYAAVDARALTGFGIALPLLAAMFELTYPAFGSPHLAALVLLAVTAIAIVRLRNSSQAAEVS